MTEHKSTPNVPKNQVPSVKNALNSRWKFFKSRQGYVLAAVFDSNVLDANPNFVQISRLEYIILAESFKS